MNNFFKADHIGYTVEKLLNVYFMEVLIMTNTEVMREMEIATIRKELLKLNYIKRGIEIDNLYFNGKLTDTEYDEMKKWWREVA